MSKPSSIENPIAVSRHQTQATTLLATLPTSYLFEYSQGHSVIHMTFFYHHDRHHQQTSGAPTDLRIKSASNTMFHYNFPAQDCKTKLPTHILENV